MATNADEKLTAQQERWKKIQRDGIWRFVLKEGVLKWGIGTAVLWLVLMSVVSDGGLNYRSLVPRALAAFPIGGLFFGIVMWHTLHRTSRLAKKSGGRK